MEEFVSILLLTERRVEFKDKTCTSVEVFFIINFTETTPRFRKRIHVSKPTCVREGSIKKLKYDNNGTQNWTFFPLPDSVGKQTERCAHMYILFQSAGRKIIEVILVGVFFFLL